MKYQYVKRINGSYDECFNKVYKLFDLKINQPYQNLDQV